MKFSELSEAAKNKVREAYNPDYDWYTDTIDYYKEEGQKQGFEIEEVYFSGFGSQGDGACWIGRVLLPKFIEYNKEAYDSDARWQILLQMCESDDVRNRVRIGASHRNYAHEYSMSAEANLFFSNADDIVQSGMLKGARCGALHEAMGVGFTEEVESACLEAARSYAREIFSVLRDEYEHLTSDEYFEEMGDFDEDGRLL